jgi:hypothetical protein
VLILYSDVYAICDYMCLVDILGTHIVSAWFSLENWVRQIGIRALVDCRTISLDRMDVIRKLFYSSFALLIYLSNGYFIMKNYCLHPDLLSIIKIYLFCTN